VARRCGDGNIGEVTWNMINKKSPTMGIYIYLLEFKFNTSLTLTNQQKVGKIMRLSQFHV
jgi:hypothetical protein